MFEKEAEEYMNKEPMGEIGDGYSRTQFMKAFQDGAEFGYKKGQSDQLVHKQYQLNQLRKANEWHYIKDGDFPKDDKEVLAIIMLGTLMISMRKVSR